MNKVIEIGRITKDPEVKMAGQTSVVNFTIAVNRRFKKDGQQEADFLNCVAMGNTANFIGSFIKKGYLLSIEGRLQSRSYDGQHGKVYVTEIFCESVENLTPRNNATQSAIQKVEQPTQTCVEQNIIDAEPLDYNHVDIDEENLPFY